MKVRLRFYRYLRLLALFVFTRFVSAQDLQVGYTLMSPAVGANVPTAAALFTYTNSEGVLVSQASVEASEPIVSGRIFVDQNGTRTGLALVNPSTAAATISMILRDEFGAEFARTALSLPAGQHLARFVDELFPTLSPGFTGSLTFTSGARLAAIALRQTLNSRSEPVNSTLPVVNLDGASTNDPVVFPQIAVGAGYTTELVLINWGDKSASGRVRLTTSSGDPLIVKYNGTESSDFSYQIAANGTLRMELDSTAGLRVGYAVVTPEVGSSAPAGTAIFLVKTGGQLVTEAGVAATAATTAARIFVDQIGSRTGVAVANPGNQTAELSLSLLDRQGNVEATARRTLASGNHVAIFADEVFSSLGQGTSGLMEIRSSVPIVPITLKVTVNTRSDLIITTLPVADLTRPSHAPLLVFPQIAIGAGFSTRLICVNTEPSNSAIGTFRFFRSDSSSMTIPLGGVTGSQFNYKFDGGRQFYPGNSATASAIFLVDPVSNQTTTEMTVTEGAVARPRLRIYDSLSNIRDDFDVSMTSLSTDVASVDNNAGAVSGLKAGFSTLVLSTAGKIATGTITVVNVTAGVSGFGTAVAQDQARRLYIASGVEHTIRLASSVSQAADIYAGIANVPGLRNDERLASLFKSPAAIAIDPYSRSIYVADSANHVIRRVPQGTSGRVETLAGTGSIGSLDGPALQATFNNPQGIALDGRGNLWVADTGNHVIRKINLITRMVSTLAGAVGVSGFADGTGSAARFSSPSGIALEPETAIQALERDRRGVPPPPAQMVVADTGNGAVRRVVDNGIVATLRSAAAAITTVREKSVVWQEAATSSFISFNAPTGIAVDAAGNIFVAEPDTRQIRTILQNGTVVPAVAPNSVQQPRGMVAGGGRLVVVDTQRPVQEVRYGEPSISSIEPNRISNKGGDRVSIRGKNFDPSSTVLLGGVKVDTISIDSETIVFQAPAFESGTVTLAVQTRGGIVQRPTFIDAVPLSALPVGQITTVAGGTTFRGDGSLAVSAQLAIPVAVAFDGDYVYVADTGNNQIRRIDTTTGIINTVAGSGRGGYSGDNGRALSAMLSNPVGVAIDPAHNLYIADFENDRVRRVDNATGIITTYAGNGRSGESGDGGPATAASLTQPGNIVFDAAGNLFIGVSCKVRRVDAVTKVITTVAGDNTGNCGYKSKDGVSATSTSITSPAGMALDASGNIFISSWIEGQVRRIDAKTGIITTIAGVLYGGDDSGDGGPAIAAYFESTDGLAVDGLGNVFVVDGNASRIRRIDATTGIITTVVGNGKFGFSGDAGPASAAILNGASGIGIDASGNLFIADTGNSRIRKVDARTAVINTVAGNGEVRFSGDGGPATGATIHFPAEVAVNVFLSGITLDSEGNLYISDKYNNRVRKVDASTGIITTIAGNGDPDGLGDGGPAAAANIASPSGVAVDGAGNLFIADTDHNRVRRVDAKTKIITTIAGNGYFDYYGDGGRATAAALAYPTAVLVDAAGNVYISDTGNSRVRRVSATTGLITTVAGNGDARYTGEGRLATSAGIGYPMGLALDREGNLYITRFKASILKVDAQSTITTVAGAETAPDNRSSEGIPALQARIGPTSVAVDSNGNLFIADYEFDRIRKVDRQTGIITTVVGNGEYGYVGDNVSATATRLAGPSDIVLDAAGNIYISDSFNNRVRAVRGPR